MGDRRFRAALAAGAVLTAGVVIAAPLGLAPGRWQLHEIGTGQPPRYVCVRDPIQLIQLEHPGLPCQRFLLDDSPGHLTIQYKCAGAGYGRSAISVEERGLIRLDTQGIGPDGRPFDARYEGRLVGECGPPPPLPPRRR